MKKMCGFEVGRNCGLTYEITSNRESGYGRCDIILKARRPHLCSYILEFKYTKDEKCDLKQLSKDAVKQIMDNRYDAEIDGKVIYIGLAHLQKHCEITWKE